MQAFKFFIIVAISIICSVSLYTFSFAIEIQQMQQAPVLQALPTEIFYVCPDTLPMRMTLALTPPSGWQALGNIARDLTINLEPQIPLSIGSNTGDMICHYKTSLCQYLTQTSGATTWGAHTSIVKTPPPDYSCQIDTTKPKTFVCRKKTQKPPDAGPHKKP
jgi:hypothetical protein